MQSKKWLRSKASKMKFWDEYYDFRSSIEKTKLCESYFENLISPAIKGMVYRKYKTMNSNPNYFFVQRNLDYGLINDFLTRFEPAIQMSILQHFMDPEMPAAKITSHDMLIYYKKNGTNNLSKQMEKYIGVLIHNFEASIIRYLYIILHGEKRLDDSLYEQMLKKIDLDDEVLDDLKTCKNARTRVFNKLFSVFSKYLNGAYPEWDKYGDDFTLYKGFDKEKYYNFQGTTAILNKLRNSLESTTLKDCLDEHLAESLGSFAYIQNLMDVYTVFNGSAIGNQIDGFFINYFIQVANQGGKNYAHKSQIFINQEKAK
jgi:hypothetical protein